MDMYKKKIKRRITILTIAILFLAGIIIINNFFLENGTKEFLYCFESGLGVAFEFLAVLKLIKYRKIINDDKKLKLQYNLENDERKQEIRKRAGAPMILFTSVLMVAAGVIAGYFNKIVFITLIAAALIQMLLACAAKFYYSRIL